MASREEAKNAATCFLHQNDGHLHFIGENVLRLKTTQICVLLSKNIVIVRLFLNKKITFSKKIIRIKVHKNHKCIKSLFFETGYWLK